MSYLFIVASRYATDDLPLDATDICVRNPEQDVGVERAPSLALKASRIVLNAPDNAVSSKYVLVEYILEPCNECAVTLYRCIMPSVLKASHERINCEVLDTCTDMAFIASIITVHSKGERYG